MKHRYLTHDALTNRIRAVAAFTALALLPLADPALSQELVGNQLADRPLTMETLLDRIQIEDFITRYYYDLSVGKSHELADYFTEDALLDVDSTIARGHAEIGKLYERPEGAAESQAQSAQRRRGHMLLTNPIINVEGDRATIHVLWTGVMNEGLGKPPALYEQGREYTELRKVNGKWLISTRYITSDSGLPDRFDATFQPREHR